MLLKDSSKTKNNQELVKASIDALVKTLDAGHSDALSAYLTAMSQFHNYSFQNILDLAANILDARIATAHSDRERAIEYSKNAVQIQDSLYYGEPPEWFYPVRESLGAALLLNRQPAQAEAVFRADLEQYPRNPRSLFGLLKSLEAQNRTSDAEWVSREFETAWKSADVTLELGDL